MTDLSDLLLTRPISDPWGRWLLFFLFYLHLLFILMLIGTAVIGVHHFLHSFWTGQHWELRWDKKVLKKFIIPKAIGVAIGTVALVQIQTTFAVPFYTAVTMFAPYWLAVFPIMIFGFFFVDGISHKLEVHPYLSFVLGVIGMILVLIIPGVFVVVLVTMENSDRWIDISQRSFHLPVDLLLHWLTRYLHVIGAAVVVGAAFQYVVTAEGHEYRKRILIRWMLAGLLAQFVIGGLLTLTIQHWVSLWTLLPLLVGIGCAVILVGLLYARREMHEIPHLGWAGVILLPILLAGMLLTRQYIQQQKVVPLIAKLDANAQKWRERLEPMRAQQAASYSQQLRTVRDDGGTIYWQSCRFCHGATGQGDGEERGNLLTPPEQLVFLRTNRQYIYHVLQTGMPGTAMPYFTIYEKYRINALLDYLGSGLGMYNPPEPVPVALDAEAIEQGRAYFNGTCSYCHGLDGTGGEYSRGLQPPPPNFQVFSLTPQRDMEVITEGYPGTAMPPFRELPVLLRWSLVHHVLSLRTGADAPAPAAVQAANQSAVR